MPPPLRAYPRVEMPASVNPLASLADLMQVAAGMRQYERQGALLKDEQRARAEAAEERTRLTQSRAAEDTVARLMNEALVDNGQGVFTFDRKRLATGLTEAKLAHRLPALTTALDEMDEHVGRVAQAKRDAVGSIAWGVHQAGNTADALQMGIALGLKNGLVSQADVQPYLEAAANPASIPVITAQLIGQSKFADKLTATPPEVHEIKVRNPDGTETIRLVEKKPGQTFTSTPAPEKGTEFDQFRNAPPKERAGILRDRAAYSAAGRASEDAAARREATLAQRGAAATWRTETLLALKDQFEKSQLAAKDPYSQVAPMTEQEYHRRRVIIQDTAKERVGAVNAGAAPPTSRAATRGKAIAPIAIEAEARLLIDEIRRLEASGGVATAQRARLAALRAQVAR